MTNDAKLKHRLAAIMATDVVGYSKLMQSDEAGALAALAAIRDATEDQIKQYQGRIANTAGDSVLAEFGSAVDAVSCAMALQQELSSRTQGADLQLRIGIHLGDVVDKAGDLFGTAVNVAARLEGIAQPGGIVVSAAVRDAITGKLAASFTDLGLKALKNIGEPLRAYALSPRAGSISPGTPRTGEALPLPSKPSIAVLPFDDLSGERDQEYFADGMVEEIITALSRFRGLFVIARNSSFAYKGRAVDVKQVGRELGVRYILEGSVRKAGNRLRISGQLIDATTSMHLWAERFDGDLADIFDLQDQVTANVVGAIAPKLEQAEIERTKHRPTDSLDAYDCYLRGLAALHRFTKEDNSEALSHFRRAVELDPNFAAAYGMAARCYSEPLAQYAVILGGLVKITSAIVPVVAVPTTAGTGSEVGRAALITLNDGRKLALISPHLIPKVAICDPELTLGLPARLTAGTGMDAITHCIETFLSPRYNPPAEAIALDGLARGYHAIRTAVIEGANLQARREMMMAALEGGLTFQKGLGAVHSMSHALGSLKSLPLHHGTLNAVLLPVLLRFNYPCAADKYRCLAGCMGLRENTDLAYIIEQLNGDLGLPANLGQMGVTSGLIPDLVEKAFLDHSTETNVRSCIREDFERLFLEAIG